MFKNRVENRIASEQTGKVNQERKNLWILFATTSTMEILHCRFNQKWVYSLIFSKTEEAINLKLLRADYHGTEITVVHSKIDSYIGLQGIVIN